MGERLKIILGYILICLLWGSTWLAIRIGLDSMTPVFSAGARFLLASVFIYFIMKFRGIRLQTDSLAIRLYLISALFAFVIPFALVYWAEQFIPSGLTSIIFAVFPFAVIIMTHLTVKDEPVSAYQIAGVVSGFLGIVVIFWENISLDFSANFWGMLAILFSSVMQAGIAVMMKKHGNHLNPLSMNFLPLLIAGISMLLFAPLIEDMNKIKIGTSSLLSIVYLALFGTVVTFTTYYWLMKRIKIVMLSISSFITPIVAVILGWLILGEKLSIRTLFGSGLVLVGILFANFGGLKNYLIKRKV